MERTALLEKQAAELCWRVANVPMSRVRARLQSDSWHRHKYWNIQDRIMRRWDRRIKANR